MVEIAERYQVERPQVAIEIRAGGSNKGVEEVVLGANDIGMASRPKRAEEESLHFFPVARDGIALVVNQANPIETLSKQQVVDIYQGKVNSWQAVGGNNMSILSVSKNANHGTSEEFAKFFGLAPESIQPDRLVGGNAEVLAKVASVPNAIGYVSIGTAEYQLIRGFPIKLLPLEGVAATIRNVSSGDFPLSRPLNLVTKERPTGTAADFIEFARSPKVSDIIQKQAFVLPQSFD